MSTFATEAPLYDTNAEAEMSSNLPPEMIGMHFPSQALPTGDTFGHAAYFPHMASSLPSLPFNAMPNRGQATRAEGVCNRADGLSAMASHNATPNNEAAMLASLAAQAQRAEAEAANAEMQYFLSKRRAAIAAARAATHNYQLLQQSMLAKGSGNSYDRTAMANSRSTVRAESAGDVSTAGSGEKEHLRRAEVEAAGAVLDLARAPLPQMRPPSAVAVPQRQAPTEEAKTLATSTTGKDARMAVTPDHIESLHRVIDSTNNKKTFSPVLEDSVDPPESKKPRKNAPETCNDASVVNGVNPLQQKTFVSPHAVPTLPHFEQPPLVINSTNKERSSQVVKDVAKEQKSKHPKKELKKNSLKDVMHNVVMPKRAFTAYNLFFAVEREKILKVLPEDGIQGEDRDARVKEVVSRLETNLLPEEEEEIEKRMVCKILREQCEMVDTKKPRRKHRKTHGKVGFVDLNSIISNRWKKLSKVKVNWYRDLGRMDMIRFQKALDENRRKVKA